MATTKLHWISALTIGLTFATGCPKDEGDDTGNDTNVESSGETTGVSATMSASSTQSTTTPDTDNTDSMSAETTVSSTISTTDPGTTGTEPQPNGSMCEVNEECESGFCFVVGILGGICGECNTDADCAATTGGGCSIPNPLAMPPEGAHCNMGEAGAGCMSSDICMDGLECAVILDVPGVLTASTCSECLTDADCGEELCSPTYSVLELSGQLVCVPPMSVPDGEGCDFEGTGDMACANGHCAIADVMGLLQLGVCSACEVDEDCMEGEMCDAPQVDLAMGLIAGGCVPME